MKQTRALLFLLLVAWPAAGQRRLVIADQDGHGPGGTNQMALVALLSAPQLEVVGITTVTGDASQEEATRHTLRMLELTGHANVPVVPGAVAPLLRTEQETRLEAQTNGHVTWMGAWGRPKLAALPEGEPRLKPLKEDAAAFLVRQVRAHPGEIEIYAGGPLTNIALALKLEPRFAELTRGIVLMGGSLSPKTEDPEFATSPRHEFNFWFDPEAARIVLRAAWPRIVVSTVDVSVQAPFTKAVLDGIAKLDTPAARYIARYSKPESYMWDELAALALIDESLMKETRELYMDVDLGQGPSRGHTLTWSEELKPATGVRKVRAWTGVDAARFYAAFLALLK